MKCNFLWIILQQDICTHNVVELISNLYLFFILLWKKLHSVSM
jgi:hypothetical protein